MTSYLNVQHHLSCLRNSNQEFQILKRVTTVEPTYSRGSKVQTAKLVRGREVGHISGARVRGGLRIQRNVQGTSFFS